MCEASRSTKKRIRSRQCSWEARIGHLHTSSTTPRSLASGPERAKKRAYLPHAIRQTRQASSTCSSTTSALPQCSLRFTREAHHHRKIFHHNLSKGTIDLRNPKQAVTYREVSEAAWGLPSSRPSSPTIMVITCRGIQRQTTRCRISLKSSESSTKSCSKLWTWVIVWTTTSRKLGSYRSLANQAAKWSIESTSSSSRPTWRKTETNHRQPTKARPAKAPSKSLIPKRKTSICSMLGKRGRSWTMRIS